MKWENQLIKDLQWSNEITNREAKGHVVREIIALLMIKRKCLSALS